MGQAEVEEAGAEAEGDGEERGGDDHGPRHRRIVCSRANRACWSDRTTDAASYSSRQARRKKAKRGIETSIQF